MTLTGPALTGPALRLSVYLSENDRFRHRPLYAEIVHRAHAAGLAGASVLRGCEGFGASGRIHTSRILSLAEELPVLVVVMDRAERVQSFLPELADLVTSGLVTLDRVEVAHHAGEPPGGTAEVPVRERPPRDGHDDHGERH